MIPKLQPIRQQVQLPESITFSDGERFVMDWVADPSAELGTIMQQCMKTPDDFCEIGRLAFEIFAHVDQKRIAHEEGV